MTNDTIVRLGDHPEWDRLMARKRPACCPEADLAWDLAADVRIPVVLAFDLDRVATAIWGVCWGLVATEGRDFVAYHAGTHGYRFTEGGHS